MGFALLIFLAAIAFLLIFGSACSASKYEDDRRIGEACLNVLGWLLLITPVCRLVAAIRHKTNKPTTVHVMCIVDLDTAIETITKNMNQKEDETNEQDNI